MGDAHLKWLESLAFRDLLEQLESFDLRRESWVESLGDVDAVSADVEELEELLALLREIQRR